MTSSSIINANCANHGRNMTSFEKRHQKESMFAFALAVFTRNGRNRLERNAVASERDQSGGPPTTDSVFWFAFLYLLLQAEIRRGNVYPVRNTAAIFLRDNYSNKFVTRWISKFPERRSLLVSSRAGMTLAHETVIWIVSWQSEMDRGTLPSGKGDQDTAEGTNSILTYTVFMVTILLHFRSNYFNAWIMWYKEFVLDLFILARYLMAISFISR